MGVLMLVRIEGPSKLSLEDLTDILQKWKFATKSDGTVHSIRRQSILPKNEILHHKLALGCDYPD